MLETLEFIAVIAVFAVILVWYLQNIHAETQGTRGLLALCDDPKTQEASPHRKTYRIKARVARHRHEPQTASDISQTLSTVESASVSAAHMRRKFRRQDEARYRVKDKKRES